MNLIFEEMIFILQLSSTWWALIWKWEAVRRIRFPFVSNDLGCIVREGMSIRFVIARNDFVMFDWDFRDLLFDLNRYEWSSGVDEASTIYRVRFFLVDHSVPVWRAFEKIVNESLILLVVSEDSTMDEWHREEDGFVSWNLLDYSNVVFDFHRWVIEDVFPIRENRVDILLVVEWLVQTRRMWCFSMAEMDLPSFSRTESWRLTVTTVDCCDFDEGGS